METRTHKADTPERIHHVSKTQLSVARHFGACTYNGANYTYLAESDELVRNDVLKRDTRLRQQHLREERARWTAVKERIQPGRLPGF